MPHVLTQLVLSYAHVLQCTQVMVLTVKVSSVNTYAYQEDGSHKKFQCLFVSGTKMAELVGLSVTFLLLTGIKSCLFPGTSNVVSYGKKSCSERFQTLNSASYNFS